MSTNGAGSELLLRVSELRVCYGARTVIDHASFELRAGETLGLVGESGSGKSTLARAILRLVPAAGGSIEWRGRDLLACRGAQLRQLRRDLQLIFQDPLSSLDPRMPVGDIIAEPLAVFEPGLTEPARRERVAGMLERVGLSGGVMNRYPHEFSGGQCQRIGIARAMMSNPKLLICDEPVSSLDVSVQGQVVNLLLELQQATGMALLFISHNLAVVRHLSHRIAVMYHGRLVEVAGADDLFTRPAHPYTADLLAAVPSIDDEPRSLPASPPILPQQADGCRYRNRCAFAIAQCSRVAPSLEHIGSGRFVACHRGRELLFSAP